MNGETYRPGHKNLKEQYAYKCEMTHSVLYIYDQHNIFFYRTQSAISPILTAEMTDIPLTDGQAQG